MIRDFSLSTFTPRIKTVLNITRGEIDSHAREKYVSVISLHEFYRLNLERAGRSVAKLRTSMIIDAFSAVDVDTKISY